MSPRKAGRMITTGVVMTVLVLVVLAMAYIGVKQLTAPLPSSSSGSSEPTCKPRQVDVLKTGNVKVSVFNAGGRQGEAGTVAQALHMRGFVGGDVSNAPSDLLVPKAQVWTTTKKDRAAVLVARNLGPTIKVVHSGRDLGPGVDVIVGPKWRSLSPHPHPEIKIEGTVSSCSVTGG